MAKAKNKNTKEVSLKKKKLKKLQDEKKKLELEIKSSSENIKIIISEKISEYSLNKLPIESLKDLYSPPKSVTEYFNLHSKERKNQITCSDKILNLEHQIYQAKIDLVIEKINNILNNLN